MENTDQTIKKTAAFSGLALGPVLLVLNIFLYYFMTSMTTSFVLMTIVGPFLISLIIPLGITIFFCRDLRKKIGGFWNFKQATTGIFVMFFVAYLISFGGNLLFSKVIEPDMVTKMETAIITASNTMYEKQGMDQDKIDALDEKMSKSFDEQKNTTFVKTLGSMAVSVILVFVVALIFAAFFKKEAPLFAEATDVEPYKNTEPE